MDKVFQRAVILRRWILQAMGTDARNTPSSEKPASRLRPNGVGYPDALPLRAETAEKYNPIYQVGVRSSVCRTNGAAAHKKPAAMT
jgi:hypothetical protein